MPRVGSEFAGYRLDSLIGHGGMSIVFRAEHIHLERTVALKLLMPELTDESFKERFMRESRLAASLDHPNVIPIYEAGEEHGVFYISMRFVEGATLKALLERQGPLSAERTASIIGQIASALHAAHEQKSLVHRDVKPANILIVPEAGVDGRDHVYLSDFGIAKQRAAAGLTKTGMFVGTADYAAPEQIEGKELDRRADIYSLGCVLYECLTGAPTYERDSEVALMYAHLLEPPPAVTPMRPDLDPEIDEVLKRAMAKDRDERYPTVRDFSSAVRKALTGTESGTAPSVVPPGIARPTVVAKAPAAAEMPAAPPPPAVPEPAGPPAVPPAPRGMRSRRNRWIAAGVIALAVAAGAAAAAVVLTGGGGGGKTAAKGGSGQTTSKTAETLMSVVVPTEVQRACTMQKVPSREAIESEVCAPRANARAQFPDKLTINFYASGSDVLAAYKQEREKSGVKPGSGRCDRVHWSGEGTWHHASNGKFGGHRVCYLLRNGTAVVAWTHEKRGSADHVDMLAVASEPGRGSNTSLFSWWKPEHEVIGKCRANVIFKTCLDTIKKLSRQ